nr:hypothetical protein [Tanacetum cinerariifolium]
MRERCGIDLRNGVCPLCHLSNSCAYDHNSNSFDYPPDPYHPPHPTYETYSGDTCRNDSHFGYDCPPQFLLNYEPEPGYIQNYNSYPHDSPSFPQHYPCCEDCGVTHDLTITPTEPIDSLSMGDEHLDTIPETESDEFIKSSVENLVPNPSESEGESECDVPAGFTTFSNVLFDADYDSDSSDDQSLSDEDAPEKIYLNPFFDEEIIPMEIDQHSFNVESDLIESMPNHDSSITISSKIDSLFDEFAGELTLLKSIPPGIDETDCHPEKETRFAKRLLYDNSFPQHSSLGCSSVPFLPPLINSSMGELGQAQRPKTSASWEAPHAYQ